MRPAHLNIIIAQAKLCFFFLILFDRSYNQLNRKFYTDKISYSLANLKQISCLFIDFLFQVQLLIYCICQNNAFLKAKK